MLHPNIELRKSRISGRGLFASSFIPKGTVLWIHVPSLEITYPYDQFDKFSKKYQNYLIKYAYWWKGKICLGKDNSKYWNHSCDPNAAPVPSNPDKWDFAIKDIQKDEELTYDYALFMDHTSFPCQCNSLICRKKVNRLNGNTTHIRKLKSKAIEAEEFLKIVNQPLVKYLAYSDFLNYTTKNTINLIPRQF